MTEMKHSTTDSSSIDLDAWRLLPWLANDTLEGEELERVLDHLKHSQRCREELLFLSELRHAVELSAADGLDVPEVRLTGLLDRIDAHETARRESHDSAPVGGPAALRVLAQAALVVLLAGAVWWLVAGRLAPDVSSQGPEPTFQTLSSNGAADGPPSAAMPRLRLIPEQGLSEEGLRSLVLEMGAEIVAGPTAAGVYTLGWRSPDPARTRDEMDELARTLRGDARVALAESVRGR